MAGNHFYADVEAEGLTETLDRLRTFDRKTYDAMKEEISEAGEGIVKDARALTPADNALSNWGAWNSQYAARKTKASVRITKRKKQRAIPYDGAAARAGYETAVTGKFRKGRRLSTQVVVQQKNAGGAIWALAGSDTTDWGATGGSGLFRQNLNRKYGVGPWPRALNPAWAKNKDAAADRLDDLVAKYAAQASSD